MGHSYYSDRYGLNKIDPFYLGIFALRRILDPITDCHSDEWLDKLLTNKADLWVSIGKGFLVTQIWNDKVRSLFIAGIYGKSIYDQNGMRTINALAVNENCERIVARASKPGVFRHLRKLGFTKFEGDLWVVKTQVQMPAQQLTLQTQPT